MPTTSRPPKRKSKSSVSQSPLKGFRLKVTLIGGGGRGLEAAAAAKGLTVDRRGGGLSLAFEAPTAEAALEKLRLLSDLLASKG